MIERGDRTEVQATRLHVFIVLVALLAIIGYSTVWLYLNYADRGTIAGYWGHVVATGALGAIALALGIKYEGLPERSAHDDTAERRIGVAQLGRHMVATVYASVATWGTYVHSGRGWSLLVALFAAIVLVLTLRETSNFLEELERRHYRSPASSTEWGWLLMSLIGGQTVVRSGFRLLGAGLAAAIAIPYMLYLQSREVEVLSLLPPEPTAHSLGTNEEGVSDQPWEGLPPIKRLL